MKRKAIIGVSSLTVILVTMLLLAIPTPDRWAYAFLAAISGVVGVIAILFLRTEDLCTLKPGLLYKLLSISGNDNGKDPRYIFERLDTGGIEVYSKNQITFVKDDPYPSQTFTCFYENGKLVLREDPTGRIR